MAYSKIAEDLKAYEKLIDTPVGQAIMSSENLQTKKAPAQASAEPVIKHGLQSKRLVDIMNTEYADLIQPVSTLICEGLTVFAGQSKIGKSRIIHLMCMAVAAGEPFLGRKTTPGNVLYMALEDGERRLKDRTADYKQLTGIPLSENLHIITRAPTAKDGLITYLQGWIDEHKPVSMIVIDTLQKVRGVTGGRANVYETDSVFMSEFKDLADKNHVAIVMCHHLNKSKDTGDSFDRISGSTGILAISDTGIILTRDRGKDTGKIQFVGRDVWGDDIPLSFINGLWQLSSPDDVESILRQEHESNAVVRLIRDIFKENPHGFRKTYSELYQESLTRYRNPVAPTIRAMSSALAKLAEDFMTYDRLSVKTGLNFGTAKGVEVMPVIYSAHTQTEQISIEDP